MKALFFSLLIVLATSCKKDTGNGEYKCTDPNSPNRIGAMCKDGTRSNSTGSGTCSGHGGVDHWICK